MIEMLSICVNFLLRTIKPKPEYSNIPNEIPLKICHTNSKVHYSYIESIRSSNNGKIISGGGTKYATYNQKQYTFLANNPYNEKISYYAKVALFEDKEQGIVDNYFYINIEDVQPGHTLSEKLDIHRAQENYYLIELVIKNSRGEIISHKQDLDWNLCHEALYSMTQKEYDNIKSTMKFVKSISVVVLAVALLCLILPVVSILHLIMPWFVFWPLLFIGAYLMYFMVMDKVFARNNIK